MWSSYQNDNPNCVIREDNSGEGNHAIPYCFICSRTLNEMNSGWIFVNIFNIFTVRNEVAKVMFLHLSVHRGEGGLPQSMLGYHSPPWQGRHPPSKAGTHPPGKAGTHPSGMETPQPADGYCCGWYASYWNAFLYFLCNIWSQKYSSSNCICSFVIWRVLWN